MCAEQNGFSEYNRNHFTCQKKFFFQYDYLEFGCITEQPEDT